MAPGAADSAQPSTVIAVITESRDDTTQLLVAALGEPRMRALRAQGTSVTEDQFYAYARIHIDAATLSSS